MVRGPRGARRYPAAKTNFETMTEDPCVVFKPMGVSARVEAGMEPCPNRPPTALKPAAKAV
jgi:hypothetical protein